jgi:hypothetical protein
MQQQQRFYLTSLCLEGSYCHNVLLIQLLIAFGSHLCKLRVDFDCLLNLIIDVENNSRLKSVMLHKTLIYLELDTIYESVIDLGDFRRVVAFLFDNSSSLRHVTLFPIWYLNVFDSSQDMKLLIEILSSFKHCKQLISIVVCHCVFSDQSYNNRKITSIENDFHKWLNDNTHLKYEQNFHLECDKSNKTIKLWLKQITNNLC